MPRSSICGDANMTNPGNWPDPERPGVVMWPHKDGRHLFALGDGYIVAFWRADKQWLVCDDDHDLGFCASDRVKDLNYIGPVLTPHANSGDAGGGAG